MFPDSGTPGHHLSSQLCAPHHEAGEGEAARPGGGGHLRAQLLAPLRRHRGPRHGHGAGGGGRRRAPVSRRGPRHRQPGAGPRPGGHQAPGPGAGGQGGHERGQQAGAALAAGVRLHGPVPGGARTLQPVLQSSGHAEDKKFRNRGVN